MKWLPEDIKRGDAIRVKIGSIYHYGIYVSDDEVIQFGLPPIERRDFTDESIVVCSTSIAEFSCGQIIERGNPERAERKNVNKPSVVVDKARGRLGEGGYNLLHNNCEHFVYECLLNTHYCSQEEQAKERWRKRNNVSIFVAKVPNFSLNLSLYPETRQREIARIKNADVRNEKIAVWKLLEIAVKSVYDMPLEDIGLYKRGGKWMAKECYLSLSHSHGIVAVALSNKPVGVDIETVNEFEVRLNRIGREKFLEKICAQDDEGELSPIELWTRKESLFKRNGKGWFHPSQIVASTKEVKSYFGKLDNSDYCLSVATYLQVEIAVVVKQIGEQL